MGNQPSLLTKSPQEHIAIAQKARLQQTTRQWRSLTPPVSPRPAPGYIRVEYYESLNGIRRMKLPDLEGDVLLESNGGLDLSKVRDMWGLENCVPICPMRWKEVEPEHPDRLSPVAVVVLSEGQDSIKFIERSVSTLTQRKRDFRTISVTPLHMLLLLYQILSETGTDFFEKRTPFPIWYRQTSDCYASISWKQKQLVKKYESAVLRRTHSKATKPFLPSTYGGFAPMLMTFITSIMLVVFTMPLLKELHGNVDGKLVHNVTRATLSSYADSMVFKLVSLYLLVVMTAGFAIRFRASLRASLRAS